MAGDETSKAARVAETGIATIIRAANKPPRTRIPTFMQCAPVNPNNDGKVHMWH
jgi:hypothetical protein